MYDNEKEKWRILTNNEIYAMVKKPTIADTIRLNRLHCFGHVERMEENRICKKVLDTNLEKTRLRGRPRNRWQDEVRDDGRLVGGRGWKEGVYVMGKAPEHSKDLSNSAHANGMNYPCH